MKISSDFTNDRGVPFVAVRIEPGEPYGNIVRRFPEDSHAEYSRLLIARGPLIEFYDRRYPHTELGQFVSRYLVETLAHQDAALIYDDALVSGLCLDCGIADWRVTAENMRLVRDQLYPQGV